MSVHLPDDKNNASKKQSPPKPKYAHTAMNLNETYHLSEYNPANQIHTQTTNEKISPKKQ